MLVQWQEKYPTTFDVSKGKLKQLTLASAQKIDSLLTLLEEQKLLNEAVVSLILSKGDTIDSLQFMLDGVIPEDCLNISIVMDILEQNNYLQLHENISFLKANALLNEKILSIITSSVNPQIILSFIVKLRAANIEVMSIFNNEHVIDSLYDLIFLLDSSTLEYCEKAVPTIFQLARILANPMSSAIFNSWNRSNSAYTMAVDPYSERIDPLEKFTQADRLINQLKSSSDFDTQLQKFFDFCAKTRFSPNSLKDMDDMASDADIELLVLKAFVMGEGSTFNTIKYGVAAEVVSVNWYSTLGYDDLMSEIKVQVDLLLAKEAKKSNFETPIKNAKPNSTYQSTMSPLKELSVFGKRNFDSFCNDVDSSDGYEACDESTDSETERHAFKRQNIISSDRVSPRL